MQAPVTLPDEEFATKANSAISTATRLTMRAAFSGHYRYLALAVVSGVMLWLCHFPVAWGWLGWVALVPVLPLLRVDMSARRRFLYAWLAGSVYFWPAISWMTVADYRMVACWAMLSLYCSLYFPLAIFMVRGLERGTRLPLILTLPAVWTALEYFRSFFGTGFSWYLLAHTQHDALQVIQISDLGGAFAVTFLVAAVNVIIFEALARVPPIRQWLHLPQINPDQFRVGFAMQLGCVALMLGGTLAYGAWQLSHNTFEAGPRIALLQGNVDQRLRIDADRSADARAKVEAVYINLCMQAAMLEPKPQVIVWPETSFPSNWITISSGVDLAQLPLEYRQDVAFSKEWMGIIGAATKTNLLLGLNTRQWQNDGKIHRYNSALLVDGKGNAVQRYDKIHRVAFGEYVPFRDWVPFMNAFAPYDHDYSIGQGDGLTRITLGKYSFGVLICYEDADQSMARDYGVTTADGPPVDFLLNISNDGWFNGSSEHEEHLAVSRFRAIETRRALARSVNMGISAVIDGNGRVLAPVKIKAPGPGQSDLWTISPSEVLSVGQWHTYKQTEGIVVVDMPIDRRTSLYAVCGDWLPYSCWALVGIGLAWGWRGRKRTPSLAAG
ncbi:MAG TPA: apolipoprotein N-acyltransferase [Gemmataceae bacterium]|nr:apolipoprotein N-acyltransferase [Gemmataceae bacterium]